MADENQDIQAPKVPKDKEGVFAVIKAYIEGTDISDPSKRAVINALSDMIQSSNLPIAQILETAKVMVDNLVAQAKGEAETKERSVSKGLKIQTAVELSHELNAEQQQQLSRINDRLKQLAEDRALLNQTTTALSSKVNTILKNILPGMPPLEQGPEGISQFFNGLTEEEKKKKAEELKIYLPDIEELGKKVQERLGNNREAAGLLVEQNKIVHKFDGDTVDAQITEFEDRKKRGESTPLLDKDYKEILGIKQEIQKDEKFMKAKNKVTEFAREHTKEQSEKIQKESEKIQKESEKKEQKLEAKQEELVAEEDESKQMGMRAAKRMGKENDIPKDATSREIFKTLVSDMQSEQWKNDKTVQFCYTHLAKAYPDIAGTASQKVNGKENGQEQKSDFPPPNLNMKTVESLGKNLIDSGMKSPPPPPGGQSPWTEKNPSSVKQDKDNKDLPKPPDPNGKGSNGRSR